MVADPQSGVQRGVIREDCLHFHVLIRHGKGHLGGVVLVRGQEGVCFLFLIAYLHRPAGEVLSLRRNGCQVHGFTHRHSAAARYGRIAAFNGRRHMVADPQSGVQSGVARKVCLYFHVLSRHDKAHFGGVVRVRFQEGVRVLLNTIHRHRPAGKALVGFRLPARCCYSIALSSFGLIHSAVYRCDVIRNIAIIRFRLNIIGGHGQGRGGVGAILQQLGKFCFVRDFSLSTIYDFIQFPACKCLSYGSISGSQSHFSACGHRGIQHFVLKLCCGIVCGHSVQRTHITACIAVIVFCIGVIMGSFRHLFSRQARAVCSSALPPVFGTVMVPLVIMPMHIQVKGSTAGIGGAAGIVLINNRSAARGNFQFGSVPLAIRPVTGLADIKISRQLTQVVDAICIHGNLVTVVACINTSNRRHYHIFIETQRGQFIIAAPQISPLCVLTYIQHCQLVFIAFHGAHC